MVSLLPFAHSLPRTTANDQRAAKKKKQGEEADFGGVIEWDSRWPAYEAHMVFLLDGVLVVNIVHVDVLGAGDFFYQLRISKGSAIWKEVTYSSHQE